MCLTTREYKQFEAKREGWIECLSGDDRHSIRNQIIRMIWDAAVFRVINEARRLAPKSEESGVQLNGMVHKLIDKGFFVSQAIAIRQLMDKSRATGKKGVYSLYGLLDDMQENAHLMTREHIFSAEGLQYDYEPIRRAWYQHAREQVTAGERASTTPERLKWRRLEERHKEIDRLSGVDEGNRTRRDTIRTDCFRKLKKEIEVCEEVSAYVNKFIAHAATPGSRAVINADDLTLTLGHLWDAHEAVYKVASYVSIRLLTGSSLGGLATPQYNQFKHITCPLVIPENVPPLRDVWKEYHREVGEWGIQGLEAFDPGVMRSRR